MTYSDQESETPRLLAKISELEAKLELALFLAKPSESGGCPNEEFECTLEINRLKREKTALREALAPFACLLGHVSDPDLEADPGSLWSPGVRAGHILVARRAWKESSSVCKEKE